MYEIKIYIVAKDVRKTLAITFDEIAAIEYAMTINGAEVFHNGNLVYRS